MNFKHVISVAFIAVCAMLLPEMVVAQNPMTQQLPIDTAVRYGTLPNGLTYIVRHNANPKNRANFYIAQKVGSILEEDSQAGLAHFLEHMAFNGTKNFPGKNLISFLERIGCRFGADLNAYTAFDETVYTIMDAPTNKIQDVDSCLLIMHDWSNNITLDGKEIDEERGVIHEEWRVSDNANMRMLTKLLPVLIPNNKYAHRLPIGTMEVVDNFPHKVLRDFYQKWYRPDLQGIIVVGDIDPDYIVKKLKEIFADVPKPVNAAERYFVKVEENEKPIIGIATDKEATTTNISIMYKHEPMPREARGTMAGMMMDYMNSIVSGIINERFAEITQKPNAPFLRAGAYDDDFIVAKTMKALTFVAMAKDGGLTPAMKALVQEIERIRQYGFLASEYERARTNLLKEYEDKYNERDKQKNGTYCEEYKTFFLDGGYIPGIEAEYEMIKQVAPMIPVEAINQYVQSLIPANGKNMVMMITGPDKKGITYPTAEQLVKDYDAFCKLPVEAKKEEVSNTKLIDKDIKPGKIVSEKKDQKFGTTVLKLSNGIQVAIKPTNFKSDEIRMSAITNGGTMLYKDQKDIPTLKLINALIDLGGLGQFDAIALSKALTGRTANVGVSVNPFTTSLSGNTTKADFETMLQLTYLYFNSIRTDKDAYKAFEEKIKEQLAMKERNPMSSFSDSVSYLLYNNDPMKKPMKAEDISKVNYERGLQIVRERLANADGFQFTFVGNIDIATAKPLIEKYLGSLNKGKGLPMQDRKQTTPLRSGKKTIEFTKDFNTPTGVVLDVLKGAVPYNQKNILTSRILSGILDQTLIASIRERESGTYSPSGNVGLDEYPESEARLIVNYNCNPDRAAQLNGVVYDELNKMVKDGINESYFVKTVTNMKKSHGESVRENSYWLGNIETYNYLGRDYVTDYDKVLDSITTKDVQDMLKAIVNSGNRLELFLRSNQREAAKTANEAKPAK